MQPNPLEIFYSCPNPLFGFPPLSLDPSTSSGQSYICNEQNNRVNIPDSTSLHGQTGVNQMGGTYINGKALPDDMRLKIIALSKRGLKAADISRHLKVSHGCVSKLLRRYKITGSYKAGSTGGSKPKVAVPKVVETIRKYKEETPNIFAWEIKERLLVENVCTEENVPSISSINRVVRITSDTSSRRSSLGSTSPSSTESTSPPTIKKSPTSHFIRDILGDVISSDEDVKPLSGEKRKRNEENFDNGITKSIKLEIYDDFLTKHTYDKEISPYNRQTSDYFNVHPAHCYPYTKFHKYPFNPVCISDVGHQADKTFPQYPVFVHSTPVIDHRIITTPCQDTLNSQHYQGTYNLKDYKRELFPSNCTI